MRRALAHGIPRFSQVSPHANTQTNRLIYMQCGVVFSTTRVFPSSTSIGAVTSRRWVCIEPCEYGADVWTLIVWSRASSKPPPGLVNLLDQPQTSSHAKLTHIGWSESDCPGIKTPKRVAFLSLQYDRPARQGWSYSRKVPCCLLFCVAFLHL